ncbi:hypothetical protein HG15A2_43800 [Adhaeretor mobilis]|uniref:Uncharacterized protein n=1 Tax=Adhaeretor mobilis TaxID=1930276 RepID=A0A517N1Z7_9BACT|nr:hypothetical protein HG15A2_43800 [Adhaeretor mobilis]
MNERQKNLRSASYLAMLLFAAMWLGAVVAFTVPLTPGSFTELLLGICFLGSWIPLVIAVVCFYKSFRE